MKAKDSNSQRLLEEKTELISKLKIISNFPGEWDSARYGDGYEFANLREFNPGDNLSRIHFPTLAHTGEYYITERLAQRSLNTDILVDYSGSMLFYPKPKIRRNVVGLLSYSALQMGSSVGLISFSNILEHFLTPKMGRRQLDAIIDLVFSWDAQEQQPKRETDITSVLREISRFLPSQSFLPIISDFWDRKFEDSLKDLSFLKGRHDFIPIVIRDPFWERDLFSLTRAVRILGQDPETGQKEEVWLDIKKIKEMQRETEAHFKKLEEGFSFLGLDYLILDSISAEDCFRALSGFFQARRKIRR